MIGWRGHRPARPRCEVYRADDGLPIYSLPDRSNKAGERNRFVSNEERKADDMNGSHDVKSMDDMVSYTDRVGRKQRDRKGNDKMKK